MKKSIWAADSQMPAFDHLKQDLKTDILIIGGGMAGILCAWKLEQAGVPYALVEADTVMGGTSRNTTAKLTSQHGLVYHKLLRRFGPELARQYWQANEDALSQFRQLAQAVPCDFEEKTNYVYTTQTPEVLEAEWAALEQLRIPADSHSVLPLPFPVAGAISFSGQAQFHPLKFAAAITEKLNIYEHTPVRAFEGNTVITDRNKITADRIIIATHFPINNKHGLFFLKQYQHRSYVIALKNGPQLDGMYLDDHASGLSLRNYGPCLLLGGGGHRTGKKSSGWAQLRETAKTYYPEAVEVCHWAAQDCRTLDDVPYIGRYSRATPNLYVATGFNKWGMTGSMAAATLLADLVQGIPNPNTGLFDPSRSILRPQLAVNALESTLNLLTPTVPRCPHLGCALKWNPAEHSWDCPCHGSRFTEDGKLLDTPAKGDLK